LAGFIYFPEQFFWMPSKPPLLFKKQGQGRLKSSAHPRGMSKAFLQMMLL